MSPVAHSAPGLKYFSESLARKELTFSDVSATSRKNPGAILLKYSEVRIMLLYLVFEKLGEFRC